MSLLPGGSFPSPAPARSGIDPNSYPGGKEALFDAILLNARGEGDTPDGQPGSGDSGPGNGETQVAQAATGTMSDAMPEVTSGDPTRVRIENADSTRNGAQGGLIKVIPKVLGKVLGTVGLGIPADNDLGRADRTWTIPGHPEYQIVGKDDQTARTLQVKNADGGWDDVGPVDMDSDADGSYIDATEVNDVLGDRNLEPIGGTDAGQISQSKSTSDDDGKTKAPPTTLTEVGDRQEDDSCAPEGKDGAWVVVNRGGMSDEAEAYQQQITRTPDLPGKLMIEYEVTDPASGRSVKMDGCAVWSEEKELLEAKYRSGKSQDLPERRPDVANAISAGDAKDFSRQVGVIGNQHPVDVHVSEGAWKPYVGTAVRDGTKNSSNFDVIHTPPANQR